MPPKSHNKYSKGHFNRFMNTSFTPCQAKQQTFIWELAIIQPRLEDKRYNESPNLQLKQTKSKACTVHKNLNSFKK